MVQAPFPGRWRPAIESSVGPTHRGVFEVVQAVVGENEPAPFPGLHATPWWVGGHVSVGL